MDRALHIAFEAARLIESEETLGLYRQEVYVDPDVDPQGNPFVCVKVAGEGFSRVQADMPDVVTVLNKDVQILVMPFVLGMH